MTTWSGSSRRHWRSAGCRCWCTSRPPGHHCPIQIERRTVTDSTDTPLPLLTTFLSSSILRPEDPETGQPLETLRHALKLRLLSVRTRDGRFFFRDHLEQTEDWQDVLVVDIVPAAVVRRAAGRLGDLEQRDPARDPELGAAGRRTSSLTTLPTSRTCGVARFRCHAVARPLLGEHAAVQVTVTPRDRVAAVAPPA